MDTLTDTYGPEWSHWSCDMNLVFGLTLLWVGPEVEELHLDVSPTGFASVLYLSVVAVPAPVINDHRQTEMEKENQD